MFLLEFLFIFIILAGLFSVQFLSGCMVLIFFFTILGVALVFFSLNFIWVVTVGIVAYLFGFAFKYWKWIKLPDLNHYLAEHPQCKLPQGVSCYRCRSENINHHGLYVARSKLRFYTCSSCGTVLFKFKLL